MGDDLLISKDDDECDFCDLNKRDCGHIRSVKNRVTKIELPYSNPFTKINNKFLDFLISIKEEPARNLLWYLIVYSLKYDGRVERPGCSINVIAKNYGYGRKWLYRFLQEFEEIGLIKKFEHGDGRRRYANVIEFNHGWEIIEWNSGKVYKEARIKKEVLEVVGGRLRETIDSVIRNYLTHTTQLSDTCDTPSSDTHDTKFRHVRHKVQTRATQSIGHVRHKVPTHTTPL